MFGGKNLKGLCIWLLALAHCGDAIADSKQLEEYYFWHEDATAYLPIKGKVGSGKLLGRPSLEKLLMSGQRNPTDEELPEDLLAAIRKHVHSCPNRCFTALSYLNRFSAKEVDRLLDRLLKEFSHPLLNPISNDDSFANAVRFDKSGNHYFVRVPISSVIFYFDPK